MERPPEQQKVEKFDIEKSPAKEAYVLLSAKTPLELSNLYSDEDQKLMNSGAWDYGNPELLVNKVKEILESIDPQTLTDDEIDWRQEILWFWYHHAISCAIWRYRDRETAKNYVAKALDYQPAEHPNQITRLFDFLVNDKVAEAEQWAESIKEEPEKSTASLLVEEYKEGKFF
jgi:hypothetical protein